LLKDLLAPGLKIVFCGTAAGEVSAARGEYYAGRRNKFWSVYLWVFKGNEKAIRFYKRLGGIQKEQSMKTVFGYDVLSRKIEWDNLPVICENQ